jgi:hypothetical protein
MVALVQIANGMIDTATIHRSAMKQTQPFMVRLRPTTRELLDRAAEDQRRSRASIIDELIREGLTKYADVNDRLHRFLQGAK